MTATLNPYDYNAWYHTPRGAWIGRTEFSLIHFLLQPVPNSSLLDVGCGTGWFSRRFVEGNLCVTGIDPDKNAINFARSRDKAVQYLHGSATALPFANDSFDYVTAVTSLCFVQDVSQALQEMWRVCRHGMVLGLLNQRSLLYLKKQGTGGYTDARWDSAKDIRNWACELHPLPQLRISSAIFLPGGTRLARISEKIIPSECPFGGFLAAVLRKADIQI